MTVGKKNPATVKWETVAGLYGDAGRRGERRQHHAVLAYREEGAGGRGIEPRVTGWRAWRHAREHDKEHGLAFSPGNVVAVEFNGGTTAHAMPTVMGCWPQRRNRGCLLEITLRPGGEWILAGSL